MSGVHNNLKKGLLELGHKVILVADSDNYKGFTSNTRLIKTYSNSVETKIKKIYNYVINILYMLGNRKVLFGNDVVQFISPFIIPPKFRFLTSALIRWNKKCSYYVCGTNPFFLDAVDKFDYFPFDEDNDIENPNYTDNDVKYFIRFLKKMDYVIPAMYTYSMGFEGFNLQSPIPLPGRGVSKTKENNNNTIKILHGISRFYFKGSKYILGALEEIKSKYNTKVEIEIVERIPFSEYIKRLDNSDIVIDQCKSYDYGMNAIFALENGKVVLSGAEQIALDYNGLENCPIINIKPDAKSIYKEIENIITGDKLNEQKEKGLHFVNKYHDPKKIGKMFIDFWNK